MNALIQKITPERLSRIPKRFHQDWQITSLLKNWREVLSSKLTGKSINTIKFRNGLILQGPPEVNLNFLFQEVWVDEIYCQPGYEIEDGNIVIDIGANIGVFATFAAMRASNVEVLAFEPFPENAKWLKQNVSESNLLSKIKVYEQAVAGVTEERTLQISDSWILHTLSDTGDQKNDSNEENTQRIKVQCVGFEDVMKLVPRCDLLKIDCEGSEYEIFYTTPAETIKKIRRIVGEFHFGDEDRKNGKALCDYLESLDFRITEFTSFSDQEGVFSATNNSFD
jgi:FkbM family methyltransferase